MGLDRATHQHGEPAGAAVGLAKKRRCRAGGDRAGRDDPLRIVILLHLFVEHVALRTTGCCPRVKREAQHFCATCCRLFAPWRDGKTDEREDTGLPGPGLERRAQAPNRFDFSSASSWQRPW